MNVTGASGWAASAWGALGAGVFGAGTFGAGTFDAGTFWRIPVDPDAPEASGWLRDELAKAPYRAAQPTWFDRVSKSFLDWLASLTAPGGAGLGAWLPLVLTVVVVAALVTVLLVFGLPRLNRRSTLPNDVFGAHDERTAEELRRAALAAASSKDWNLAETEMFRALARGLFERTILVVTPGTTATGLAARAARAFPDERGRLEAAATGFDAVRYLGRDGTETGFNALVALERDLRSTTPARHEDPAPTVPA
jgi:hypothetical protein